MHVAWTQEKKISLLGGQFLKLFKKLRQNFDNQSIM